MTLADLKSAAALLAPGSCITLSRDALLTAIGAAERQPAEVPQIAREQRLLTVTEVARRLGIKPKHVYRRASTWPFTRRLGTKLLRFDEQGLEKWLARQTTETR